MIKIDDKENFEKLLLDYDIFLFDMLGVVWSGSSRINGTLETLEFLKNNNKTVVFVSNSPETNGVIKEEFSTFSILQHKHYDEVATSGDVLHSILKNKLLKFETNKKPKNYYIFGPIDSGIIQNIAYNSVENIKDADFVLLGFPQLNKEEYNNLDEKYKNLVFESPMYKESYFDSLTVDVFMEKINEIKNYNLPIVNDCADLVAMQPSKNDPTLHYVLRHGTIANKYKEMGGEVLETSKPHSIIYDFAFNRIEQILNCKREDLKNKKILMLGDTINTDILGATNATNELGIRVGGLLTLCGVSGKDFNKNITEIDNYCQKYNLNLDYIIDDLGVILK